MSVAVLDGGGQAELTGDLDPASRRWSCFEVPKYSRIVNQ